MIKAVLLNWISVSLALYFKLSSQNTSACFFVNGSKKAAFHEIKLGVTAVDFKVIAVGVTNNVTLEKVDDASVSYQSDETVEVVVDQIKHPDIKVCISLKSAVPQVVNVKMMSIDKTGFITEKHVETTVELSKFLDKQTNKFRKKSKKDFEFLSGQLEELQDTSKWVFYILGIKSYLMIAMIIIESVVLLRRVIKNQVTDMI